MDTTLLFTAALQSPDPWRVSGVQLPDGEGGRRESRITIGFEPGCVCSLVCVPVVRVGFVRVSGRI